MARPASALCVLRRHWLEVGQREAHAAKLSRLAIEVPLLVRRVLHVPLHRPLGEFLGDAVAVVEGRELHRVLGDPVAGSIATTRSGSIRTLLIATLGTGPPTSTVLSCQPAGS